MDGGRERERDGYVAFIFQSFTFQTQYLITLQRTVVVLKSILWMARSVPQLSA